MATGRHHVKLRSLGLLGALVAGLITVAVLHGYREDQRVIRFFAGTGVAGKIDVIGTPPSYVLIAKKKRENHSSSRGGGGRHVRGSAAIWRLPPPATG